MGAWCRKSVCLALVALLMVSGVTFAAPEFGFDSLAPGDSSDDVALLQEALIALGLMDNVTGVYDEATTEAVRTMQRALGLEPDGIFTPALYEAYTALPVSSPSPSPAPAESPVASPEPDAPASPVPAPELTDANDQKAGTNDDALQPLAGYTIGIDPGHQLHADNALEPIAPSSGSSKTRMSAGCYGVRTGAPEFRINLQIALKLRRLLEDMGATVVMTRTKNNVSLSNIERAQLMNDAGVDFWLRLHCNYSVMSCGICGAYALVPASGSDVSAASYALGRCVLDGFCTATGAPKLYISATPTQTAHNWSSSPVVTLEMGYLSNPQEELKLSRCSYQNKCAQGVADGVLAYVNAQ